MKIVFICGSLEPGRDGVGDYTRRLAGELIRQGHQVKIIAWSDKYINKSSIELQRDLEDDIPVLRLSTQSPNSYKVKICKEFLNNFNVDFYSLQFVPYGFNKYGIPISLAYYLSKFIKNTSCQVMIHEPFLGKEFKSFKQKIIRIGQKKSIKLLRYFLNVKVWHTSIPEYQQSVNSALNLDSKILGLFGNIKDSNINPINKEVDKLKAVYFGSAPSIVQQKIIADKMIEFVQSYKKPFELVLCGKSGPNFKHFIDTLQPMFNSNNAIITEMGELEEEKLSELFYSCDFGITRVKPEFIGKSGSAISMLEHGLPIWVPQSLSSAFTANLAFRPNLYFHNIEDIIQQTHKTEKQFRLTSIAAQFCKDINVHLGDSHTNKLENI